MRPIHPASRRGASAIEFALAVPVILLLVGGIIDLSMYMSVYSAVTSAARDGCRYGATINDYDVPADGDELEAAAVAQARTSLENAGYTCGGGCSITAAWNDDRSTYEMLTVTVDYPWRPFMNIVPGLTGTVHGEFVSVTQEQN